jgi:hypothetical protein
MAWIGRARPRWRAHARAWLIPAALGSPFLLPAAGRTPAGAARAAQRAGNASQNPGSRPRC